MAADAQGGVAQDLAVRGEVDLGLPGGVEELGARRAVGLRPQGQREVQGREDARAEGGALRGLAEAVHAAPPQAGAVAGPAAGAAARDAARPSRIPGGLPLEGPVPVVHHLHVDRTLAGDLGVATEVMVGGGMFGRSANAVQWTVHAHHEAADLGVAADADGLPISLVDERLLGQLGLGLGGDAARHDHERQNDEHQRRPPQPAGKKSTQGGKAAGVGGTHDRSKTHNNRLSTPNKDRNEK